MQSGLQIESPDAIRLECDQSDPIALRSVRVVHEASRRSGRGDSVGDAAVARQHTGLADAGAAVRDATVPGAARDESSQCAHGASASPTAAPGGRRADAAHSRDVTVADAAAAAAATTTARGADGLSGVQIQWRAAVSGGDAVARDGRERVLERERERVHADDGRRSATAGGRVQSSGAALGAVARSVRADAQLGGRRQCNHSTRAFAAPAPAAGAGAAQSNASAPLRLRAAARRPPARHSARRRATHRAAGQPGEHAVEDERRGGLRETQDPRLHRRPEPQIPEAREDRPGVCYLALTFICCFTLFLKVSLIKLTLFLINKNDALNEISLSFLKLKC